MRSNQSLRSNLPKDYRFWIIGEKFLIAIKETKDKPAYFNKSQREPLETRNKSKTVLALAAHRLQLERFKEHQHGPRARVACRVREAFCMFSCDAPWACFPIKEGTKSKTQLSINANCVKLSIA